MLRTIKDRDKYDIKIDKRNTNNLLATVLLVYILIIVSIFGNIPFLIPIVIIGLIIVFTLIFTGVAFYEDDGDTRKFFFRSKMYISYSEDREEAELWYGSVFYWLIGFPIGCLRDRFDKYMTNRKAVKRELKKELKEEVMQELRDEHFNEVQEEFREMGL